MKAEIDQLDIAKLISTLSRLNNVKTKVDLDVGKLKTVPIDLKKLRDSEIKWRMNCEETQISI